MTDLQTSDIPGLDLDGLPALVRRAAARRDRAASSAAR